MTFDGDEQAPMCLGNPACFDLKDKECAKCEYSSKCATACEIATER